MRFLYCAGTGKLTESPIVPTLYYREALRERIRPRREM